ncbi:uncharacterized protein LOC100372334 [Saccoglossus kowalevskii]
MGRTGLYETLGLQKAASAGEIKKAYHKLAKQYHPDKNKAANAEEKFKEIVTSYEILKDPEKRRVYDLQQDTARLVRENAQKQETKNKSTPRETYKPYTSFKSEFKWSSTSQKGKPSQSKSKSKAKNAQFGTNGKSRNGKKKPWQGPMDSDDFGFDIPGPGPKPSFSFRFFYDDPFSPFREFFERHGFPWDDEPGDSLNGRRYKDPFDDMFSWNPQSRQRRQSQKPADGPFDFFDINDPFPPLNCAFCGHLFELSNLRAHEETCRRLHTKPDQTFDTGDRFSSMSFSDDTPRDTSNWRERHEDTLRKIRQSKKASRSGSMDSFDSIVTECENCGLHFSHDAYKKHERFCVQKHGKSKGSSQSFPDSGFPNSGNCDEEDEYVYHPPPSNVTNDAPFPSPRQYKGFTGRQRPKPAENPGVRFPPMTKNGKATHLTTTCQYCGTDYAKSTAKFCGECGAKRSSGTNIRF